MQIFLIYITIMVLLLMVMETLAVAALVLFNGILDSKYYEKLSIKTFSNYMWYPVGLLLVASYFTAMLDFYTWAWLDYVIIFAHTVLHVVFAILLTIALVRFADIPFKYSRQYLFARSALYFSVVFEALALGAFVVCCVKIF